MARELTLSTFDAPARAGNLPLDVAAPERGWTWPPASVTLITGEHEAVLVDTLSHRRADAPNDAAVLQDTIDYLEDADRILAGGPTASEFTTQMRSAHSTRLNLTTLSFSTAILGLAG